MTTQHHDTKRHGKMLAIILTALALASISLHWGWNTFAVEVISQPPITFRHALALESILFPMLVALAMVLRLFTGLDR